MRLSRLVLFFVLAFSLTSHAEDSVMIDLSVLDGLGGSFATPSKPLFPILPKKTKSVNKTKIAKKKKTTIAKPVVKQQEEKIVVVDVEPVEKIIDVTEEKINVLDATENKLVEEVQVVDVEPTISDNIVLNEEVVKKEFVEEKETSKDEEISLENSKPELLINNEIESAVVSVGNNAIVFDDGVYELTQEQISKVDEIIKSFKDPNANKIAIYSHNLDDGIDTFKKKRTSLNRAVEIRSHLIKQGYKNFSIKVINVNTNSDKINTVELEEI